MVCSEVHLAFKFQITKYIVYSLKGTLEPDIIHILYLWRMEVIIWHAFEFYGKALPLDVTKWDCINGTIEIFVA